MSLYRCSACGSPNVVTGSENSGFSYSKGIAGAIVFGAPGAVAGINGKIKQVFKCPDCGLTTDSPMPDEIKMMIDMGVMSETARNNLTLNGIKIDWTTLTGRYKNIEKTTTIIDAQISNNTPNNNSVSEPKSNISIDLDEKERNRRIYKVAYSNYIKECMEWSKECDQVIKKRESLFEEEKQKERTKQINEITQNRDRIIQENTAIKENSQKELSVAEEKLASLGFFKFSEKKETKNNIEFYTMKMQEASNAISNAKKNYTNEVKKIDKKLNNSAPIKKKLDKKHPMPLRPKQPKEILQLNKDGSKPESLEIGKRMLQICVFEFIENNGSATFNQIKTKCDAMADMTDSYIRSFILNLTVDKYIKLINGAYYVNYDENPDWEVRLLTDEDIAVYEAYQQELKDKAEIAKQKKEDHKNQILAIMKGKGPITIADIREYSTEFDNYNTDSIIRNLAEDGVILKTEIKGKIYYEYK